MIRSCCATLLILAAACGPLQVDPVTRSGPVAGPAAPGASETATNQVRRRSQRVAVDSLADAAALDSLLVMGAADSMPELSLDDAMEPSWDLNVEQYAEHPRVAYYLDYFTGRGHNTFQLWLDRMPRFEGYARTQMAANDLPEDLVYLALIESGFSPIAVSRASAVGMWQFMRATGRGYGLRVDTWVDERRDPIKATDAAARHLKDLTDRFGSHLLAAAAYNGGQGRVGRGVTRIASQGGGDAVDPESDEMFFELADAQLLKRETRDYVPKLIAAALIAKAPERYDFERPEPVEPFPRDSVVVQGGTGLDLIAELAGTTLEVIRDLNPHILRGITPPGSSYPVRLPAGMSRSVADAYALVPPSEKPAVLTHVVRRGETISGIAQRYSVSMSSLMGANRVARARSLQIGTTLYIPAPGTSLPAKLLRENDPSPPRAPLTHIVRSGETVSGIAARYGVTQASVVAGNRLRSASAIRTGQKLVIAAGAPARTASGGVYEVRRGDTVGEIAERFGVSQRALIAENRLGSRATIRVGQRLTIPAR
jgi:membrane-bound lytic murein transglycosylase D